MKTFIISAFAGGLLVTPALAQTSSTQQMLQGLMTGNQSQDQTVRDAFERGYQKGRQDEAHMQGSSSSNSTRSPGNDYRDNSGYNGSNRDNGTGNYPPSRTSRNRDN